MKKEFKNCILFSEKSVSRRIRKGIRHGIWRRPRGRLDTTTAGLDRITSSSLSLLLIKSCFTFSSAAVAFLVYVCSLERAPVTTHKNQSTKNTNCWFKSHCFNKKRAKLSFYLSCLSNKAIRQVARALTYTIQDSLFARRFLFRYWLSLFFPLRKHTYVLRVCTYRLSRHAKIIVNMSGECGTNDIGRLNWHTVVLWWHRQAVVNERLWSQLPTTIDSQHIFLIHASTDHHGRRVSHAESIVLRQFVLNFIVRRVGHHLEHTHNWLQSLLVRSKWSIWRRNTITWYASFFVNCRRGRPGRSVGRLRRNTC